MVRAMAWQKAPGFPLACWTSSDRKTRSFSSKPWRHESRAPMSETSEPFKTWSMSHDACADRPNAPTRVCSKEERHAVSDVGGCCRRSCPRP